MHNFVRPSTFTLEDVDRKLKAAKLSLSTTQLTPPDSSSEDGGSGPEEEEDYFPAFPSDAGVRPLDECIAIYEKGPRPASAATTRSPTCCPG